MDRIIEIDLIDKSDLTEKYNEKIVSNDLIKYIIDEATFITKKDDVKIIINKKCEIKQDCTKLITEGLKREYAKSLRVHHIIDIKQLSFFILGILFLFLSTLLDDYGIWKEFTLIAGWVPIWEMIDLELFSDFQERRKRKILKKLLKGKIIEK